MAASPLRFFIGMEGIDAVGKRTQTSILSSLLASKGLSTRTISFPDYGTTIGREIRKFLQGTKSYPQEVRALLYAANRWERKGEIEAIISRTDVTIVNRYTGSNLAYGMSNGLRQDWLMTLEVGLPKPDLVIVLDAPPVHLRPRRGFNKDTYERNLGLQERARRAYLNLASELGWKVIDATQGIDPTSRAITSVVSSALSSRGRPV